MCSMPMKWLRAISTERISSSSLAWIAAESRFWVFCTRKTIRKVTMVVPVLMTSCQTSEKPKIGPVTAQTTTAASARMKASGRPAKAAIRPAMAVKIVVLALQRPARPEVPARR